MIAKSALTILMLALCSQARAQNVLNNDSVRKLTASGIPSDTLVRIISTQPGSYSTSPSDLASLSQAGVAPEVLAALVSSPKPASGSGTASVASPGLMLHDGTPVRLRLTRTLSSAKTTTGDKIDFDVLDDVRVGDRVVISRSSKAIGAVTEAEQKRRMGRAGKLNLVLEYVRVADGTKVALRAQSTNSGHGHVGAMTAGIVATSLVLWPAAPLFLMMHGKDAVIPEGTEITAYVDGDTLVH